MMTLLAATRLMPREPARVEMRNKRPLGRYEREREFSCQDVLCYHLNISVVLIVSVSEKFGLIIGLCGLI